MMRLKLLSVLGALCFGMAAQAADIPTAFTYSNVVLNTTGTVAFVAAPQRLWVKFSAQTLTNDVYLCMTSNALQAVKTGLLMKFTQFTNNATGANPEFTFPVEVTGYGPLYLRSGDGSTPTIVGTQGLRK